MRNSRLYTQLKQNALDNDYTIEQVNTLEYEATKTLLGEEFSYNFFTNIRNQIAIELTESRDQTSFEGLQNQLKGGSRVWLKNNFPDAVLEKGKEFGKQFIKIWLYGKPEVEEIE